MKSCPVYVPRESYRGSNAAKARRRDNANRIATKIESHINDYMATLEDGSVHVFLSYDIAGKIGEDAEIVRLLVCGIDGGSNGVTVLKGSFEEWDRKRRLPPDT